MLMFLIESQWQSRAKEAVLHLSACISLVRLRQQEMVTASIPGHVVEGKSLCEGKASLN